MAQIRSDDARPPPVRRRRGADLRVALLDAAWAELCAVGYPEFTLDGVAGRAGTSRPVLARRWSDRTELIIDALAHHAAQVAQELPNTGTLRGDALALLRQMSETASEINGLVSFFLADHYHSSGPSPSAMRDRILAGAPDRMAAVVASAIERGEVDPATVTRRKIAMPADLVRHDVIMTNAPISDEALEEIVDELFLPLLQQGAARSRRPRRPGQGP